MCAREKVLGLLLDLESEIAQIDKRAASIVRLYIERIERIMAEAAKAELWHP